MEMWGSGVGLGLTLDGTHAEFVVVPADAVRPKPQNLSMEQAGAVGTPYIVAQVALTRTAALQAGETVLIMGASGAVGRAVVQISHWKQARVIGADRQDANHSGADLHVNTQQHDLPDAVRSLTAGKGADVVLDAVGGPMFELALQSLTNGGRHIAIASTGGTRVSFDLVDFYHNQSRLFGLDTLQLDAATLATILDDLRGGFEAGFLTPPPITRYPLAEAVSAFEAVERGGGLSRHVLVSSFR